MSTYINKVATPPTIPGSGKYDSLETNIIEISQSMFTASIISTGTIEASSFTDGTATLTGGTLSGLVTPTASSDATNKAYVDSITGGTWLAPTTVASTANLTLSGTQTVDGVALIASDRVLVKNQTTGTENGIYTVLAGAWDRAADMVVGLNVGSVVVTINQGTANGTKIFQCINTTGNDTVGTDILTFQQIESTVTPGGADTNIQFNDAGALGGSANLTWDGSILDVTGAVTSSGDMTANRFVALSDATLKSDVSPIGDPLRLLNLLDPVQYKFNHIQDDTIHYGVLAQDLQEQGLGSMVHNVNGHLAVNYNDIVGLLIASVQELRDEVKQLKKV